MTCKRNSYLDCSCNGKKCNSCPISKTKSEFKEFIKSGNKTLNKEKKKEVTQEDAIEFWKNLIESGKVTVIFP